MTESGRSLQSIVHGGEILKYIYDKSLQNTYRQNTKGHPLQSKHRTSNIQYVHFQYTVTLITSKYSGDTLGHSGVFGLLLEFSRVSLECYGDRVSLECLWSVMGIECLWSVSGVSI